MSATLHKHRNSITLAYKRLVSNLLRAGVTTEPRPLKPWVLDSITGPSHAWVPPHPILEARAQGD